jgi:hypothetical protein
MITKKSTKEYDYEILKAATWAFVQAYCNSKSILSGCAVGQAHRGYFAAVNNELKLYDKLENVWKKLEGKYNYTWEKEVDDIVKIPEHFLGFIQKETIAA